jgi:hydroxymethylpyrimidine/phosphomethylpyrimidine kinase
MSYMQKPAVALTIAGSDSGGGAGIQADLKTFAALNVYGTCAITALTAQNTQAVTAVHDVPPACVAAQIAAVLDDFPVAAIKTGMLSSAAIITAAAAELCALDILLIVDPVMVSTSGHRLLASDAVAALTQKLFPLAALLTPNLAEAAVLLDCPPAQNVAQMQAQAHALFAAFQCPILLKGGHMREAEGEDLEASGGVEKHLKNTAFLADSGKNASPPVSPTFPPIDSREILYLSDIYVDDTGEEIFTFPYIATRNTHGTGCTLSAAITAYLARGESMHSAILLAKQYLSGALAAGALIQVSKTDLGHGPLAHFHQGVHP